MSGVDEQNRVPQCPKCNKSHEICVGNGAFMFPENARVRRGLKYMLYFSQRVINRTTPPRFYDDKIICVLCGTYHNNNTGYYNKLKSLFDRCVARKEYYDNDADFYGDDDADAWDADGNFKMELNE